MSIDIHIFKALNDLSEAGLVRVAEFLKFRNRFYAASVPDKAQIAETYAKSGEEDRILAEEGMSDDVANLREEDVR